MKAKEERYESVSLLGHPALFTSLRIQRDSVPMGIHLYEVRHEDDNGMRAAQIGHSIQVNHMGSLLMRKELPLDGRGYLDIEEKDLVFTDSGICELWEYMRQYPKQNKKLDATKETFDEVLIGDSQKESVLYHEGLLASAAVPGDLQVLYAYRVNSINTPRHDLRLFVAGKTIPVMPFMGTYISTRREGGQLALSHGEVSISQCDIFSGREGKMTLQEYMRENGIGEKPAPKKKKQEPER